MYGDHVHKAVLEAQEPISGISIHLVDEQYDHGRTLCQVSCPVIDGDSPHSLLSEYTAWSIATTQLLLNST